MKRLGRRAISKSCENCNRNRATFLADAQSRPSIGSQLSMGLDALPKTGLGLGVVAHLLVALARYPHEAIVVEFHPIRAAVEIAFGRSRADASPTPDS